MQNTNSYGPYILENIFFSPALRACCLLLLLSTSRKTIYVHSCTNQWASIVFIYQAYKYGFIPFLPIFKRTESRKNGHKIHACVLLSFLSPNFVSAKWRQWNKGHFCFCFLFHPDDVKHIFAIGVFSQNITCLQMSTKVLRTTRSWPNSKWRLCKGKHVKMWRHDSRPSTHSISIFLLFLWSACVVKNIQISSSSYT